MDIMVKSEFKKCFGGIYAGKKVLVTGNTGFKGSWLSLWLLSMGAEVYGLADGLPGEICMFDQLHIGSKIHQYTVDVRNYDEVRKVLKEVKPDFLFHLAAQALVSVSYRKPLDTISTNVMGTANILEALREENPPCTAVIITSDKCYDNVEWVWGYKETDALGGKDIYSGSKGAAELIFKSYYNSFFKNKGCNVRLCTARAGNVIGGGDWALDRLVPDCMRSWKNGKSVEIRSPDATRPWQHVLEPLSGYLMLAWRLSTNDKLNGESFNFGPKAENTHTVIELLSDIGKIYGLSEDMEPYKITGIVPFREAGLLKLNCDKALFFLKWTPTLNYKELVDFTAGWYKNWNDRNSDIMDFTMRQISEYENKAELRNKIWLK
ncbi:MAG: CDP-glucose 4,6-dehydratase [Bacteroidales bacterium]|jgi:CDP-glucose 4,6-dehydratase|nr:CDP-glucose 4,6-dehydratase [Bacteroidales bacterium]